MKYIQVTKSEEDTEPMLDRPCQMGFGYADMRQLQKLFNCPLISDEAGWDKSLLGRLGNQDYNVISAFMVLGLNNFRKQALEQPESDKLIEKYLDDGGEMADLVRLLRRALEVGGHIPKKKPQETEKAVVSDAPGGGRPLVE